MELEEMTVKDLQDKLVGMGMPEDDVQAFKTKAPLIATINTLMAKSAEIKPEEEKASVVEKKVASITEAPNPTEDREVNKRYKAKAMIMRDLLNAQEKVNVLIPLEAGDKMGVVELRTDRTGNEYQVHVSGAIESVQLNGYKYLMPKGVYVQVPRQIAEVIAKAQQQTLTAGSEISLDRIDVKTGRPFSDML